MIFAAFVEDSPEELRLLILVSDLHLADDPIRASFDAVTFLRELAAQLDQCPEGDTARLVLLGDVFELLKTARWRDTPLRPWHPHSDELGAEVAAIARAIIAANDAFFAGLRQLQATRGLQV